MEVCVRETDGEARLHGYWHLYRGNVGVELSKESMAIVIGDALKLGVDFPGECNVSGILQRILPVEPSKKSIVVHGIGGTRSLIPSKTALFSWRSES